VSIVRSNRKRLRVEGFVNKVKWIKRSSYGQAGFPLLQRRVLLHPARNADQSDKQSRPERKASHANCQKAS
jgi:hypothetical protein